MRQAPRPPPTVRSPRLDAGPPSQMRRPVAAALFKVSAIQLPRGRCAVRAQVTTRPSKTTPHGHPPTPLARSGRTRRRWPSANHSRFNQVAGQSTRTRILQRPRTPAVSRPGPNHQPGPGAGHPPSLPDVQQVRSRPRRAGGCCSPGGRPPRPPPGMRGEDSSQKN